MKNILIITPIKHLTNVLKRAEQLGNIIYKPYIDSNELK